MCARLPCDYVTVGYVCRRRWLPAGTWPCAVHRAAWYVRVSVSWLDLSWLLVAPLVASLVWGRACCAAARRWVRLLLLVWAPRTSRRSLQLAASAVENAAADTRDRNQIGVRSERDRSGWSSREAWVLRRRGEARRGQAQCQRPCVHDHMSDVVSHLPVAARTTQSVRTHGAHARTHTQSAILSTLKPQAQASKLHAPTVLQPVSSARARHVNAQRNGAPRAFPYPVHRGKLSKKLECPTLTRLRNCVVLPKKPNAASTFYY